MNQQRRGLRVVAVLLGVSVGAGAIGFGVARSVKSPAEIALRTAPPRPSRLTAPVEYRVLRSTLFTRGTVRFGSPRPVTLPASPAKAGSLVVTSPPVKGTELADGTTIGLIGGRPVLALAGPTPMYRDIRPGDTGDDVMELQTALERLGYRPGRTAMFDGPTQQAISAFLTARGYEPFGPTDTEQATLRASSDGLGKASDQVVTARAAYVAASKPVSADKTLAADEVVRAANDRVATAQADAERISNEIDLGLLQRQNAVDAAQVAIDRAATDLSGELNAAEADQAVNTANLRTALAEAAVTKAAAAIDTANADVLDATQGVADAQANVTVAAATQSSAEADLVRIKAKAPPTIPVGGGTFEVDIASYQASVRQGEAAVTAAVTGVRTANGAVRMAQRTVDRANRAVAEATAALESAKADVVGARETARIAELRRAQTANLARSGAVAGAISSPTGPGPVATAPSTPGTASNSLAASAAINASTPGGSASSGAVAGGASSTNSSGAASSGSSTGNSSGGAIGSSAQLAAALQLAQAQLAQAQSAAEPSRRAAAAALRSAEAQVTIAVAQRTQTRLPPDTTAARAAVVSAEAVERQAKSDRDRLSASIGIVVPANEIVFFSELPLRIDDTKLVAGDALTGPLMTVSTRRLAVDASVDPSDAPTLRTGQRAEIEASDLGIKLPATITKIADTVGTDGVDPSRIYVELTPTQNADEPVVSSSNAPAAGNVSGRASGQRTPRLADLNGVSVKVTIPISTTNGKVLAVPTAAVAAAVDGTVRVEVEIDPSQPTRFVTVTAGLRADGYVQITPTGSSTVKAGDLVVTGAGSPTVISGTADPGDVPVAADTPAPADGAGVKTTDIAPAGT